MKGGEIVQRIDKGVTNFAKSAFRVETPAQSMVRELREQENSLKAETPNGDTHSVIPLAGISGKEAAGLTAIVVGAVGSIYLGVKAGRAAVNKLEEIIDKKVAKEIERRKPHNQENPENQEEKK